MKFRTPVNVQSQQPKIDHNSRIFLLGSCFVENIGEKMDYFKLQNYRNPFGILYHPAALERFIANVVNPITYTGEDIFFHNERWHSFDAHSDLSDPDKENLLSNLNRNIKKTHEFLQEASHVIITLGTAWGYRSRDREQVVSNCHKVPQKEFSKELIGIKELEVLLRSIIENLNRINPELTIIFTISPVRHIKDGITGNQRSKAHLISALHNVLEEGNGFNENTYYFPAYEILMDDLRDYRFYAEDMLHPSGSAIEYIWRKFTETWISENSHLLLQEIETIQRGLSHRPFNPESNAHQKFLKNLQDKIESLRTKFPHLKF